MKSTLALFILLATSLHAFGQTDPFAANAPADPFAPSEPKPFFEHFMQMEPASVSLAELKPDMFNHWLNKQGLSLTEIKLKQGTIPLAKVMLVSPAGIKAMTDRGIEVFVWDMVDGDIATRLGWTPRVQERYTAARKEKDYVNRVFAADAREKAARAAIAASRDASTQRAPALAEPSVKMAWPADPAAMIRSEARKDWPDSFTMQEFVIKQETEAWQEMTSYIRTGLPGVPADVSKSIIINAVNDWPRSFHMMAFVAKKEVASWRKINAP